MIILNTDEIIFLHCKLVERTGGGDGIRDMNLLESAIYSASASYCGSDAYPTIEEKAARLMYSLTNNHAFIDGNKRIGVVTMLVTLRLNNIKLQYTQSELIEFSLGAADNKFGYDEILEWIRVHK